MSKTEEDQETDMTFWVLLLVGIFMALFGLYIYLIPYDNVSYFPKDSVGNFSTTFDSGTVFAALS